MIQLTLRTSLLLLPILTEASWLKVANFFFFEVHYVRLTGSENTIQEVSISKSFVIVNNKGLSLLQRTWDGELVYIISFDNLQICIKLAIDKRTEYHRCEP